MLKSDLVSSGDLCAELRKIVEEPDKVPSYRAVSDRLRDGRWPTVRLKGRVYTERRNLPLVAKVIGLELKSVASKPRSRKGAQ